MPKLGTLRADLETRTSKWEAGLERGEKSLKRFKGRAAGALKKLAGPFAALAGAAAIGAVVGAVQRMTAEMDKLKKTADRLGLRPEAFQELEFAASQSGLATEQFTTGLQRFIRRSAEAARGTGEARKTLKELGIQLTDTHGRLRPAEDLLGDVADAMSKVENRTDRVRIAFKLFDSEGVGFVNLLGKGSAELNHMRQRARELGLVLDSQTLSQVEKANDQLDIMARILEVNLKRAVVTLLPTLIKLGQVVGDLAPKVAALMNSIAPDAMVGSVEEADRRLQKVINLGTGQGSLIERYKTAFGTLVRGLAQGQLNPATMLKSRLQTLSQAKADAELIEASLAQALGDPIPDPSKLEKARDILKELRLELEGLQIGPKQARLRDLVSEFPDVDPEKIQGMLDQIEAQGELNQRLAEYRNILEEARSPLERFNDRITRLTADYQSGAIDAEKFHALVKILSERFEEAQRRLQELAAAGKDKIGQLRQVWEDFTSSAASALADFVLSGKRSFKDLIESMIRDMARMALQRQFTALLGQLGGALFGGPQGSAEIADGYPGRETGGLLSAGQAAIVGERGPELFVPDRPGFVVRHDDLVAAGAGGGPVVNVTLNASPGLNAAVRQELMGLLPELQRSVLGAVRDAQRRGGSGIGGDTR